MPRTKIILMACTLRHTGTCYNRLRRCLHVHVGGAQARAPRPPPEPTPASVREHTRSPTGMSAHTSRMVVGSTVGTWLISTAAATLLSSALSATPRTATTTTARWGICTRAQRCVPRVMHSALTLYPSPPTHIVCVGTVYTPEPDSTSARICCCCRAAPHAGGAICQYHTARLQQPVGRVQVAGDDGDSPRRRCHASW